MIDRSKAPEVYPVYADNGEHSHFKLIDVETGETLWEEPEESMCDSEHIAPVVRSNAAGWIKVSERLPKYKQKILLYNKNLRYPHVGEMVFLDERGSHFKCETIVFDCLEGKRDCCKGFTHWMPLPEEP